MRRMYSEQELTNVIKAVFEQELEDGALDENVADAVDAYLVEHPVDVTALEGQDVELNSLDADGLITGGEIVEKMSGYSFTPAANPENLTKEYVYAGVVKNGNKITFVIALNITRTGDVSSTTGLGSFTVPTAVLNKLYPTQISSGNYLDIKQVQAFASEYSSVNLIAYYAKSSSINGTLRELSNLTLNTKYYVRYEVTFLLSNNLVPEE